jgi:hypothetical protein
VTRPHRAGAAGARGPDLRFHPADPDRAATLSARQVSDYNAHGFIRPIDVFDASRADEVRAYIDALLDAVLQAGDRRNAYSINAYHLVCRGMYDLAVEPRILDCVEDILGPNFVCWGSHLFAKMPGDRKEVPFHQDAVYWPLTPSKTVTAWLAIDDADVENAAMAFIPGSHLHGGLEHDTLPLDGSRVLGRQVANPGRYGEPVPNELRAGQMSLHSDLLLHGSGPNRSRRRRAGLTLRYAAADVRLVDGHDEWRRWSIHCRGGDPEGFWADRRRPDGERPELMADVWGEFDGTPVDAA